MSCSTGYKTVCTLSGIFFPDVQDFDAVQDFNFWAGFFFFAWFYHSKNSGPGFWHWAENCKNNLLKKKETRAFRHRVSIVVFRSDSDDSQKFSMKERASPVFSLEFFMSSSSELNITPRFLFFLCGTDKKYHSKILSDFTIPHR